MKRTGVASWTQGLVGVVCLVAAPFTQGCSAAPEPKAFANENFYLLEDEGLDSGKGELIEWHVPRLDADGRIQRQYVGVAVLGGFVRLSRPSDWTIRSAGRRASQRFVEWVSPRQFTFSVFERVESPRDPWRTILDRFQAEAKAARARVRGEPVPFAAGNAQGRVITLEQVVDAPGKPILAPSRVYLLRGASRVVAVQVVHAGDDVQHHFEELARTLTTLEVL